MRTYRQVIKEILIDYLNVLEKDNTNMYVLNQCLYWESLWDELDEVNRLDDSCPFEVVGENIVFLGFGEQKGFSKIQ